VKDLRRRPREAQTAPPPNDEPVDRLDPQSAMSPTEPSAGSTLARSMARLKPRERDLLWLAYAQGSSHKEIAQVLGLKAASIKLLLFRARRRLAAFFARADDDC